MLTRTTKHFKKNKIIHQQPVIVVTQYYLKIDLDFVDEDSLPQFNSHFNILYTV